MKTKKILLIIVAVIGAYLLIAVIVSVVKNYQEKSRIENSLNQISEAIESKKFNIADSIYNEIEWQVSIINDGENRIKECKQNLERAKFRFKVDELFTLVKENEIPEANQKYKELLFVDNTYLLDEDTTDYLISAGGEIIQAERKQMKPYLDRAKQALAHMSIKKDEFRSVKWYTDNSSPKYSNANGFYLYFGEEEKGRV